MYIVDDKQNKRGKLIINFNVLIPKGNIMSVNDRDSLREMLEKI